MNEYFSQSNKKQTHTSFNYLKLYDLIIAVFFIHNQIDMLNLSTLFPRYMDNNMFFLHFFDISM